MDGVLRAQCGVECKWVSDELATVHCTVDRLGTSNVVDRRSTGGEETCRNYGHSASSRVSVTAR